MSPSTPPPRRRAPISLASEGIRQNAASSSVQPRHPLVDGRAQRAIAVGHRQVPSWSSGSGRGARDGGRSDGLPLACAAGRGRAARRRSQPRGRGDPRPSTPPPAASRAARRSGGTEASAMACLRIGLQPWLVALPTWPRPAAKTGTARAVDDRRDGRRQALRAEQPLDAVPVEGQADEPAGRPAVRRARRSRARRPT